MAVFGQDEDGGEKVLRIEKRRITAPETTFELMFDECPLRVGIDPWYKLIDTPTPATTSSQWTSMTTADGAQFHCAGGASYGLLGQVRCRNTIEC